VFFERVKPTYVSDMLKNIVTACHCNGLFIYFLFACVSLYSRRRTCKNEADGGSGHNAASSDNFYSIRCEPGGAQRYVDTKTSAVDENGYEVIVLPVVTQQMSAESRPRIARRPPLPIDRRSLSMQGSGFGGAGSGSAERNRVPVSRYGSRPTVNGIDADVRQLIDEVRCQVFVYTEDLENMS